jgi:hypothetical protein
MYIARITNSVVTTLMRIAPTKKPASRMNSASQAGQWCLILNGLSTIDDRPHTGHRRRRQRRSVLIIEGRTLFTISPAEMKRFRQD